MSATTAWTDDRVQTLTRLWRDGLSASQIARALAGGVTRNAVIGKVHRLGLSGRRKPSLPGVRPQCGRRAAKRRAPVPRAINRLVQPATDNAPPPARGTATILTVRRGQCRWPIGDPLTEDFSICGCAAVRGAYCGRHAELAYRPLSKKPPRDQLLKLTGLA